MDKKVSLLLEDGSRIELPILIGSRGPDVLDVKNLYKETGLFVYDPGFVSTASCSSAITFIDGDKGILEYRGNNVADLARDYDFVQVMYLLFYRELPNCEQYEQFLLKIQKLSKVSEQVIGVIKAFPSNSHPMPILMACFASLSSSYHRGHGNNVSSADLDVGISAIAQIPAIVAMIHRHISNQDFIDADHQLSYGENFLRMMFGESDESALFVEALNKIFILHADHEQNASTASVRLTGSAGSNLFVCLAAGVATLWGPAHGGANEAVINMLREIEQSGNVEKFIIKAKDDGDPFKLMGFGHRVYKNYDPRALILKETCYKILNMAGSRSSKLLKVAMRLEETVLKDEYFIERKLYPNVDFYSGIIMSAIGIPSNMFTPIFALARTAGWVAQWYEMMNDKESKIWRPRQLYVGKIKDNCSF